MLVLVINFGASKREIQL